MKNLDVNNLGNQFLIAMLGIVDDNFAESVVYRCDHSFNGELGLSINKLTVDDLAAVFRKVDLKLVFPNKATGSFYYGGPMQIDRGFVLHDEYQFERTDYYSLSLRTPGASL